MDYTTNERHAVGKKAEYSNTSYLYGCKKLFSGQIENLRDVTSDDYVGQPIDLTHQANPIYNHIKLIGVVSNEPLVSEGTSTTTSMEPITFVDLKIHLLGYREELSLYSDDTIYSYFGTAEMDKARQEWSFSQTPHTIYLEVEDGDDDHYLTIFYQESL